MNAKQVAHGGGARKDESSNVQKGVGWTMMSHLFGVINGPLPKSPPPHNMHSFNRSTHLPYNKLTTPPFPSPPPFSFFVSLDVLLSLPPPGLVWYVRAL